MPSPLAIPERRAQPRPPAASRAPRPDPVDCGVECPVQRAARLVEGKWTTLVVRELLGGTRRFTELQRAIAGISPRLLTERLRLLEHEGALTRAVHATIPPTTEYTLTAHGRRLQAVIEAMAAFGLASQRRDRRATASPERDTGTRRIHRLR